MAVAHRALGVQLARAAGGEPLLVNPVVGEVVRAPGAAALHFDQAGWGYIRFQDGSVRWAKDLLQFRVVEKEGGRSVVDKGSKVAVAMQLWATRVLRFPELMVDGLAAKLVVDISSVMLEGGLTTWWVVNNIQDCLQLNLSARYASRWACVQYPDWQEYCRGLSLPEGVCARSRRADAARAGGPGIVLEHYALATQALVPMLLRWGATLKSSTARSRSIALLRALVTAALPTSCSWPCSLESAAVLVPQLGAGKLVPCEEGFLDLTGLMSEHAVLRGGPKR
mmetsp:Transcript_7880/g.22310  ORF Transcript_7880/g.22310 Transcript_7880/m.22310 type:complete len:281 (-) Transcript_7880:25-867(-)